MVFPLNLNVPYRSIVLLALLGMSSLLISPVRVLAQASCSLAYNLQADLTQDIPTTATDADFMEFAWNHFLALNAPAVGGQISVTGDNKTQWSNWSSTSDLLNQPSPGPSGSRYYPEVCKSIPNYQNYRVLQQTGKVDDSFLEAQVGGLSENPVIDSAGHFLRYEILLSPAMYNEVVSKGWNDPSVLAALTTNVTFSCGDVSYTGGDPANPDMGALALKVAWRDGTAPGVNSTTFHMEDLLVFSPSYRNSSNVDTCELKPMAMVGMHLGHKTIKQPNWIWATFEHKNNALDCTTITPGPGSGSVNTNCPADVPSASNLNPNNCNAVGNEACASCNTPPAKNGIGECVNPFVDPDGSDGWCLDQPPNPVGGISQLCRQVPVSAGYCSTNASQQCVADSDCSNGATCLPSYPAANDQTKACLAAIANAPGANGLSPWQQYVLISSQWEANSYTTCQNAAQQIAAGPEAQPINQQFLREQVVLAVNSQGTPTSTRPILGNTSMESYDRANCIGCHTRSYLNGVCSNDASKACSSSSDCSGGANCTQYNTDLMYFLKLEVAQPPALRLEGTQLRYTPGSDRNLGRRVVKILSQSDNVVAGQENSKDDPRCNDDPPGTVKASLRFYRGNFMLDNGKIDLPCQGWKLRHEKKGEIYHYTDQENRWGPCRSVKLSEGRDLSAHCTGSGLPDGLDQGPTQVSLVTGRLRHCFAYEFSDPSSSSAVGTLLSRQNGRPDVCPDF